MPCSGCVPYLAQHTGSIIKYWCPEDNTYHRDSEPCLPASPSPYSAPSPSYSPSSPSPYVADDSAGMTLPVVGSGSKKDCGCCGGSGATTGGTVPSSGAGSSAPCKCCDNGYSTRDALVALAVAFVVFLLAND